MFKKIYFYFKFKYMYREILKHSHYTIIQPKNDEAILYAGEQLRNCLKRGNCFYDINNLYFLLYKNKFKLCIYLNPDNFSCISFNHNYSNPNSEVKSTNNSYVKPKYLPALKALCDKLGFEFEYLTPFIYSKKQWLIDKESSEMLHAIFNLTYHESND